MTGGNNIQEAAKIKSRDIDPANYFMTLINAAVQNDMLSESQIMYIESQIADILSESIWQYTNGASTSVTNETAARLTKHIIGVLDRFCISAVKRDGSIWANDRCVETLKEKAGIKNAYAKANS